MEKQNKIRADSPVNMTEFDSEDDQEVLAILNKNNESQFK